VKNPGITSLSCSYCASYIYWDEQAIHDSGVKAVLDPPSSRMRVGEPARLLGRDVMVLGRVRYSYGGGIWDEWFLETADQRIEWVTEDEKEITHETPVDVGSGLPPFSSLTPGRTATLAGRAFRVEEAGQATCLGVEGQVPFKVVPHETYGFADLVSDDGSVAIGIEYDEEERPTVFRGKFLGPGDLEVAGGSPFPETVAGGREIRCAACGSPVEGKFPADTEMLVCSRCGAGLELSATETRVVTKNTQRPRFALEIGNRGRFAGVEHEVVGRMQYVEREEGLEYPSHEYLLWSEQAGYLWLEEENGHWVLNRRSHEQPSLDLIRECTPKKPVTVGGKHYLCLGSGEEELTYVDGALPWVAKVGETYQYGEAVAPPAIFGVEASATGSTRELEYFEGRYVPVEEMRAAFGRELPAATGVGSCQPFLRTGTQRLLMVLGLFLAAVHAASAWYAMTKPGRVLVQEKVPAEKYRSEYLGEPFAVAGRPAVLRIDTNASVDNSWVAVEIGLVNSKDEVCLEAEADVSFYSGVEGGERWSEGSRSSSQLVRVDEPGTYRLLVFGAAGTGEQASARGGESLTITVRQGAMPARWFLIMLLLSIIYPFKEISRKVNFERTRYDVEPLSLLSLVGDDD
jgi:hypothetical protein